MGGSVDGEFVAIVVVGRLVQVRHSRRKICQTVRCATSLEFATSPPYSRPHGRTRNWALVPVVRVRR